MAASPARLPDRPVVRWLAPVKRFLHIEASSGIVLLSCTVLALVLANSPWASAFAAIWNLPVRISIGDFQLAYPFGTLVINDALMTVFFFVVGLEIKREMISGELADPRKALLPVLAAIGGMLLPASLYLALQYGQAYQRGWAIPMATDIAFVVGFLALFGPRVPFGLKILLLSLAIVDDLGAVLIIAFIFTEKLAYGWLAAAGVGFLATYGLNRIGVRQVGVYVIVGAGIWLAFLKSGVHPTVAGVLLGLLTPASAWIGDKTFTQVIREVFQHTFGPPGADRLGAEADAERVPAVPLDDLEVLRFVARETVSPLDRLEQQLHPWVAFVIMPLFALANAGVAMAPEAAAHPVAWSVAVGLAVGKPAGILLFCWLGTQMRWTALPEEVTWPMLAGGACLAGIGFTMALFLNGLAFATMEHQAAMVAGKVGTLLGSLVSAVFGAILLTWALPRPSPSLNSGST